MNEQRHSSGRITRVAVHLGIWTFLVLFFATKFYYVWTRGGIQTTWTKHLWWQGMEWYSWALFSPVIFWICRQLDRQRKGFNYVWKQATSGLTFAFLHVIVLTCGARIEAAFLGTGKTWLELLGIVMTNHFHSDVFTYAAIVSCWHAVNYFRKFRQRDAEAARLQADLAEARLQALRHQLQPHFLFNTLHSISTLNHEDPKAANRMLARLSELLRFTLETHAQQIPLQQEIDFLRRYLEIEQIRFGDRLLVRFDIPDDVLEARVPTLLLQPLVENALRHGIAPYSAKGEISIRVRRDNGMLHLQISDSGPGLKSGSSGSGVGLSNTRARLAQIYGSHHRLDLVNGADKGLTVDVHIPFSVGEPVFRTE